MQALLARPIAEYSAGNGADEMLVNSFRPHFEQIEYYSWLREPDFAGNTERAGNATRR